MSTQHVNETAGVQGGADGLRQPSNLCEAHDLRLMLSDLASRISEVDQRHSKALTAMQERLSALGAAATGLREQLPAEMAPALDRIEGGMSLLAEQIAEAEAQRRSPASSRPDQQQGGETAPALRSALAADALDAFARRLQLARNTGVGEHDHFDVVDLSPPGREPDTWDSKAADELARIYESGDAGPLLPAQAPTEAVTAAQPVVAVDIAVDEAVPPVVVAAAAEVVPAMSPIVVPGPTSDEIASQIAARTAAIAWMVADLVSQQMPKAQVAADTAPAIDDLRSALETFAAEQRHGDEQISTMLDTMQQAMIRMLDRMDALEQTRYADAADPVAEQSGYAEPAAYGAHQAGYDQPQVIRKELSYRADAPAPYAPYASPQQPAAYEPPPAASAHTMVPSARPAAHEPKAADNREDFIAAARRAARMAGEAQQQAGVEAEQVPPPEARKVKINAAPKARRSMSAVSMAMVCLLLVGGGFAAVRTIGLPGFLSPSASQHAPAKAPAPQQKTDADRKVQNLEDADLIIEDDRKAAGSGQQTSPSGVPAAPRRSSLDGAAPSDGSFSSLATASLQNAPAFPAAFTKERPEGAVAARPANPMPPLSIGPTSLRNAAAKGDPSAEYEIGVRYAKGKGVPQDLQQAVSWYQRSAAQGFAPAQYRLGSMYERGLGLKADLARARVWYQRAAEQGIVEAMHNLAVLSAGRDNAALDYAVAARWFNTAAEHGLTDSQFNLAIMHDSGLGMEKDAKQAYKWFSLAARSGDDEAARRRESLKAKLTPSEVAEVENEIRAWRPRQAAVVLNDPRQAGEMWKQRSR